MNTAEKLARFNLYFTFLWLALTVPSLLWWKDSILWVIVISLWANIVGHFSAYLAARSEAAQLKGYNLSDLDKAWLSELMTAHTHITAKTDTTTFQPRATTTTTTTANAKKE